MPLFWATSRCIILSLCALAQLRWTTAQKEFSYPESTANGWDGQCSAGSNQSPIDLSSTNTGDPEIHSSIQFIRYFKRNSRNTFGNFKNFKGTLENDGTTVTWTIGTDLLKPFERCIKKKNRGCPKIKGGPLTLDTPYNPVYFLWKLNFRWGTAGDNSTGSEHTVDGITYPMELQMVHINKKYINEDGSFDESAARNDTDKRGFAIISVLFDVVPQRTWGEMSPLVKINQEMWQVPEPTVPTARRLKRSVGRDPHLVEFDKIASALTRMKQEQLNGIKKRSPSICTGESPDSVCVKMLLNPGKFIKKVVARGQEMRTYFTYHGSLTTPGCEEVVTWVVFKQPLTILPEQVDAFQRLYENPYRSTSCTQCISHATTGNNDVKHLIHDNQKGLSTASKRTRWKAKTGIRTG